MATAATANIVRFSGWFTLFLLPNSIERGSSAQRNTVDTGFFASRRFDYTQSCSEGAAKDRFHTRAARLATNGMSLRG
jgi:hypothetical protein